MTQTVALALGSLMILFVGVFIFRRTEEFYAFFARVLGTDAFPSQGARRDSRFSFFRLAGFLFLLFGAFGLVLLISELLTGK